MKNDEQAFPIFNEHGISYFGMTLRDYFAGQALIGLLANGHYASVSRVKIEEALADISYKLADAMLKAREE